MRVKNSIINAVVSLASQFLKLVFSFVLRTILIHLLRVEYLGINGLFSNILAVLSFSELGIGSAILFSLYSPIAREDQEEQLALLQLFGRVFRTIGIIIGMAGLALTPFLGIFIKDMPAIENLRQIYVLYVLDSAASYFGSYKQTFIIAHQKGYLVKIVQSLLYVLTTIVQGVVLYFTRDYIVFMIVKIVSTLLLNGLLNHLCNRLFPFVRRNEKLRVKARVREEIIRNTKSIVFYKAGAVIVNSTDHFVLSRVIGIVSVGIYSNYQLIILGIDTLMNQLYWAIRASVGNMRVEADKKKQQEIFNNITFLSFVLYSIAMICMLNTMQAFIKIWAGSGYLLPQSVLFLLLINFYVLGLRKPVTTFRESFGLYYHTRYITIAEAVLNFGLSVFLAKITGIAGVFLGTFLSAFLFGIWKEVAVLYRYGFEMSMKTYVFRYGHYLVVTFLSGVISRLACGHLMRFQSVFVELFVKSAVCIAVSCVVIWTACRNDDEYRYYKNMVKAAFLYLTTRS